jgi:Family of unknown function (DUF6058)
VSKAAAFSSADVAYIRSEFVGLEELCAERNASPDDVRREIVAGRLPRPSYVLDDGTEMVPDDYFALADEAGGPEVLREHFQARVVAAGGNAAEAEDEWQWYLTGIYGICLREVTPETILRKGALVSSLEQLLAAPRPGDATWRRQLRAEVDELDALEREFSPHYDRSDRFPKRPSRDRLLAHARSQFPEVFEW